jgi:diguanylate cyclase (GGDEF)-like protein
LASYFVDVNRKLRNPKIIELQLFQETEASVYRDELTGLFNYRYFRECLPQEIARADRYDGALSLAMIDIDDFKHYNDRHGHQGGNEALVELARLLQHALRKTDVPVRYGGEEFALVMPSTPKDAARKVVERVRAQIQAHPFGADGGGAPRRLTVSIGIATYPADAEKADELVRSADNALYIAKSRGKDQVVLFGDDRCSYRRLKARLAGSYCVVEAEFRPFTTLDVSEGGILLLTDRQLVLGQLLDIRLEIPGVAAVGCAGRVVRIQQKEKGRYETAIMIDKIGAADRTRLTRFVRSELKKPGLARVRPA